jgi:hypothetical protein
MGDLGVQTSHRALSLLIIIRITGEEDNGFSSSSRVVVACRDDPSSCVFVTESSKTSKTSSKLGVYTGVN